MMLKSIKNRIILFVLWGILCSPVAPAHAAETITEITKLHFGAFGMHKNNSVRTITVLPDNTFTQDVGIIMGRDPQRGEYLLENFTPGDTIDIHIGSPQQVTPQTTTSPSFTLSNFTTNSPLTIAPDGKATLYIGATLATSGSGTHYWTDQYQGAFELTLSF